jgi:hypothetical protein
MQRGGLTWARTGHDQALTKPRRHHDHGGSGQSRHCGRLVRGLIVTGCDQRLSLSAARLERAETLVNETETETVKPRKPRARLAEEEGEADCSTGTWSIALVVQCTAISAI